MVEIFYNIYIIMVQRKKGMTLIELLIVVAIIGIIAAIAVPNLLQSIQRSRINRTFADLSAIKSAIGMYMTDHDHYPRSQGFGNTSSRLETLTFALLPEKYYNGPRQDAWGIGFDYISDREAQNYVLISYGTDQELGWSNRNVSLSDIFFTEYKLIFRGWSPTTDCMSISYEDTRNIIKHGCDLVIMNGEVLNRTYW